MAIPGLVICDLDGTLADTRADLAAAVNALRAEYGLGPLTVATVTGYVGEGVAKLIERALAGHPHDPVDAAARMERHYHDNLLVHTALYPTVRDGLDRLHGAGWRLAVVTNKPAVATRKLLAALGIADLLAVILGGGDAPLKPDPGGLLMAMERTGVPPERAWMIGDNWTDLAAGRNAGIPRCFARYGFGRLKDESFDLAVDRFADFTDHVLSNSSTTNGAAES